MSEENCTPAKFCRGFTLIELMMVVIIAGIMTTLAIPFFRKSTDRGSVQGATDAISSMHARARLSAIQRGRVTRLHMRPTGGTMWVTSRKATGTGVDTIGNVEDLGSRFGTRFTVNVDSLTFTPRGIGAELTSTTIVVTKGTAADTITISAAGRVVH